MRMEIQYAIDALYDGVYLIQHHGKEVEHNGVVYTYHSSGLCRQVYVDPDRKFVLKIPIIADYIGEVEKQWKWLEWPIKHNILEALAYEQCPDELKGYFAKTELLSNCWIKQEFVKVLPTHFADHTFREYGVREDGSICLFDYDPIIQTESYAYGLQSSKFEDVEFTLHDFTRVVNKLNSLK